MGNCIACMSQQRRRHETAKAPEQNSLKNLQNLKKKKKKKSALRSHNTAKNRSGNRRILPTNFLDGEEITDHKEEVQRVKMLLTKKEVKELLFVLSSRGGHGDLERDLVGEVEESERIGWTPSLQSIPESDDCGDQREVEGDTKTYVDRSKLKL